MTATETTFSCCKCGVEFSKITKRPSRTADRVCPPCQRVSNNAKAKEWAERNSDRLKQIRDRYRRNNAESLRRREDNKRLVSMFGITLEDYERMFAAQRGLCAICNKPESVSHKGRAVSRLAVDHDHETGEVRALLCFRCNTSLGHFENNGLLLRALAYVEGNYVVQEVP